MKPTDSNGGEKWQRGRSQLWVLADREGLKGSGVSYTQLPLPLSFQVMIWGEKTVHLQFPKEDWKVTEGQRGGPNEPAHRHQPAVTGASAAPYQHVFYSARIRKTKGHRVPIHQQGRVIKMLMRCILIVRPQPMGRGGNGSLKTRIKHRSLWPALPCESKLYRTTIELSGMPAPRGGGVGGWRGIKIRLPGLQVISRTNAGPCSAIYLTQEMIV